MGSLPMYVLASNDSNTDNKQEEVVYQVEDINNDEVISYTGVILTKEDGIQKPWKMNHRLCMKIFP